MVWLQRFSKRAWWVLSTFSVWWDEVVRWSEDGEPDGGPSGIGVGDHRYGSALSSNREQIGTSSARFT